MPGVAMPCTKRQKISWRRLCEVAASAVASVALALPRMRGSDAFDAYVRVCDDGEPWVQEITYDTPFGDGYMLGTFDQRTARRYSYSDRLRYYWADDEIEAARQVLLTNLDRIGIPLPLISQFLPAQYDRIRSGQLEQSAQALVIDRVRDALRPYARACDPSTHEPRDLSNGAADD